VAALFQPIAQACESTLIEADVGVSVDRARLRGGVVSICRGHVLVIPCQSVIGEIDRCQMKFGSSWDRRWRGWGWRWRFHCGESGEVFIDDCLHGAHLVGCGSGQPTETALGVGERRVQDGKPTLESLRLGVGSPLRLIGPGHGAADYLVCFRSCRRLEIRHLNRSRVARHLQLVLEIGTGLTTFDLMARAKFVPLSDGGLRQASGLLVSKSTFLFDYCPKHHGFLPYGETGNGIARGAHDIAQHPLCELNGLMPCPLCGCQIITGDGTEGVPGA